MSYTNEALHQQDKKNYLPTFNRFPIAFSKGSGSRLWDVEGKQYIDMLAGIAVNSVGHCHPRVAEAISKQSGTLMHISNFFVSEPQVNLAARLVELSGLDNVFFTNSGAESVEGAMKVARRYAHKKGRGGVIISMKNCFHGRTLAAIATGKKKQQEGFDPIPSGFSQLPFNDLDAVKASITKEVAAIIVEPVQGEGGIIPADKAYLRGLRELCDFHDVVLIFDEIQTGIGRTGKWFAKDHYGVQPDIMALAKGLGGGFPLGAFLCKTKIGEAIEYGDHGTTFGGNPLACAAGLATLAVIEEEDLCGQAEEKGKWLRNQFESLRRQYPLIREVRGLGLMNGVELSFPALPLVKLLLQQGVIANATADNVLRLVPPLNIDREDLETAMQKIEAGIKEIGAKHVG